MYVILIGVLKKVLVVWLPCNNIRKPRAKFWILTVAGNLMTFETEACINPKGLIVEISLERLTTVVGANRIEKIWTHIQIPWLWRSSLPADWYLDEGRQNTRRRALLGKSRWHWFLHELFYLISEGASGATFGPCAGILSNNSLCIF